MKLKALANLTDVEKEKILKPETHYLVAMEISDKEAHAFFRQLPWALYIITPKLVFIR